MGRGRFDDPGFSLIENMLAMVLFMLIVASALPLLIQAFQAQAGLGGKQAAVTVASRQLEYVRSLTPSKLVAGRYSANVAALTASPGLVNLSNDVTSSGNYDPTAAAGSAAAAVPLTTTQTVGGIIYTVRTYIDPCYLSSSGGPCTASASNGSMAFRVSVDVAWPAKPGVACVSGRSGQCEYVVTSLIDPSADPTFYVYGSPTISIVNDASGTPITTAGLHPGQVVTLQVLGTNFAPGATAVGTLGDRTAPVSSNTGTVLTVQYQPSSTLGARTFSIVNANGTMCSTTLTVTKSAPTVTGLSPANAARAVATTFTVTGTDFFATPSLTTQTTTPTITLNGTTTIAGLPVSIAPTVSNVVVASKTSLTFKATMPLAVSAYTVTGTLTLTNPDGGAGTYSFSVRAT